MTSEPEHIDSPLLNLRLDVLLSIATTADDVLGLAAYLKRGARNVRETLAQLQAAEYVSVTQRRWRLTAKGRAELSRIAVIVADAYRYG